MTKLLDKLKAAANAEPFVQETFNSELAALEKVVSGMEKAANKAETAKNDAVSLAVQQANETKDTEAKDKVTKILEANKKALEQKDAEIATLKGERDSAKAQTDVEAAQKNAAEQQRDAANNEKATALQEVDTLKKADAAKANEIAGLKNDLAQNKNTLDAVISDKDTALQGAATEKQRADDLQKANAALQTALQQANDAKTAAEARANTAATALQAMELKFKQFMSDVLGKLNKSFTEKDISKISIDGASKTVLTDVEAAHNLNSNIAKAVNVTRENNENDGAYHSRITSQLGTIKVAATLKDQLFGILNGIRKHLDPKATALDQKNVDSIESVLKGEISGKLQAADGQKAAADTKADQATKAAAYWSKGRLLACIGGAALVGAAVGVVAYNKSSFVQSCYKYCADSKVGCKLSDIGSFVGKLFTKSTSTGIAR